MLDTFVQQLGRELEMEDLIVSREGGHYVLPFEGNIEVEASQVEQGYYFKGTIGKFPQQNVEAFLEKTLGANLFGRGTRGAIIGLNNEGNLLTLSLEVDYNSPYKDFKDKLEDFVNVIDFWRQEASKYL